uniref:Uncharacterized protein n=1 Tax=Meloidogyne enterolobii TaxID=390850 RepID=A0A6V7W3V1_MELEN|nr:unnamed protein product [Meloidogyne enterolobii]
MEIGAITTLICVKFKVLRNNNFIENTNCYETSILFKIGNNFSSVEENIENYKNKLLSSYWTEINLIGYKIELLEKQKVEYPKELKSRIIEIGNKIRVTMEKKKRDCLNCGVKEIKNKWHKYLKETICVILVVIIIKKMESIEINACLLRLKRTIVNVLFAMLLILHNGTVIQSQDTIYVLLVIKNSKE